MDQGLIARRYAKALLETASDSDKANEIYALMENVIAAAAQAPALTETLANPFVSNDDKVKLMLGAAGVEKAEDSPLYGDFLQLLINNGRMDCALEIALAYCSLYRKANHIFRVVICSASPLGDEARQKLQSLVDKEVKGGTVEYTFKTDPSLIGGFTIDMGSERLDASVKKQLSDLRLKLLAH